MSFDYKEFNQENDIKEGSLFNQAVQYVYRLDYLQKLANYHAMQREYIDWFLTLKALYRALHPRLRIQSCDNDIKALDTEEIKMCEKLKEELEKLCYKFEQELAVHYSTGKIACSSTPHAFCSKLESFEIYLCDCINKKGLLLPKPSDDEGL